jgi:hypothetical protein
MNAAPSPLQIPLINGVRHSFASIELKVNSIIFRGVKAINYTRKNERVFGYGNNSDPLFKTRGKNGYTADLEMYLAEFNYLISSMGPKYGGIFFPVYVTYSENGLDPIQDVILGCTIDSTEANNTESADPLVRKIELGPLKILYNGLDDNPVPLVPPPQ